MDRLTNEQILEVVLVVLGSLLLGWLIKKLLIPILVKLTHKTAWKFDDLVIESTGKWVAFWFFLGSCIYVLPILSEGSRFLARNEQMILKLIGALYVFTISWAVAKIAAGLFLIRSKQDDSILPSTSIVGNIVKAIVFVIGFIIILQSFDVAIAPLVTALGVGGIAVALALQPTLSNLFSGLQIIASGKVNIGDFIQLENGKKGVITDITWRNTVIRTAQNNLIILPNSKMSDSIIENFYLNDKEIVFNIELGVSYDSNLEKVEQVAIEVGKEILDIHPGKVEGFEPFVRFQRFADSSINFQLFLKVKEFADQFSATSDCIKALHQRFNQEGIDIPYPIRSVYLKKSNQGSAKND